MLRRLLGHLKNTTRGPEVHARKRFRVLGEVHVQRNAAKCHRSTLAFDAVIFLENLDEV